MQTITRSHEAVLSGSLESQRLPAKEIRKRIILAVLFLATGTLIYLVFSPLRPVLDRKEDYLGRIALIAALFTVVLLLGRSMRYRQYKPVVLGLLIMTAAVSFDRVFSIYLLDYLGIPDVTPAGLAILKLNACLVSVGIVIFLTRVSGDSLGSIYIQKGNLRLGLTAGLIAFLLAAAASPFMAIFLFKAQDLTLARIIPWLPWLLVFILANASQEEILFRGLFLRKLQPYFGKFLSNFLIVFVFTAMHTGADFTSDGIIFLGAVFLLALAWGYLTQKTNSVWGSILFHAGMDIPIVLGIFSGL